MGILSDTHGLLRPEVLPALSGVEHILHAGDVGTPEILDALATVAPVTAIRGNIDTHGPCSLLPATEMLQLAGATIYMLHAVYDLDLNPAAAGVNIVISGHTHKPSAELRDGIVYLNPGSCGPRRFQLPVTLAIAEIVDGRIHARIVPLF